MMNDLQNTTTTLEDQRIPVRVKLAAAWTSLMFLSIYIDYFHLYQPGEIDAIRGGVIFEFAIGPTFLILGFTVIAIPVLMILLSMTLPARVNRATNLVVASLVIPAMGMNFLGTPPGYGYAFYYALTIGVEMLILAFILRAAWTWPRTSSASMPEPAVDVPSNGHVTSKV